MIRAAVPTAFGRTLSIHVAQNWVLLAQVVILMCRYRDGRSWEPGRCRPGLHAAYYLLVDLGANSAASEL